MWLSVFAIAFAAALGCAIASLFVQTQEDETPPAY